MSLFQRYLITIWKWVSLGVILFLMTITVLFEAEPAQASYQLEKRCVSRLSKKMKREERKKICACVVINLQSKLQPEQIKELEKIYESKSNRLTAANEDRLKAVLDIDFEVNKNCSQNSLWRFPKEDLGTPDPL